MPGVGRDQRRPAAVALDVDDQRRRAERREPVHRLKEPVARGVRGGEAQHRKARRDDARGAVQHLGRGEGLGVNRRGLLELQRRFGGDGEGRTAADDVERLGRGEPFDQILRRRLVRRADHGRQAFERGGEAVVPAPLRDQRAPATSAAIIDLVAATERSSPASSGRSASASVARRRVDVVDQRDRRRARCLRRPLHRDDVGTAARLRDGDRGRAREPQRRLVERGDRGPERRAGEAELQLDHVLEEERRMIRAAARDGRDESGLAGRELRRRAFASPCGWRPAAGAEPGRFRRSRPP